MSLRLNAQFLKDVWTIHITSSKLVSVLQQIVLCMKFRDIELIKVY